MSAQENTKPRIGITLGDINGVGPEIIMKALSDVRILKMCTPVVFGSTKIFARYRKILSFDLFSYQIATDLDNLAERKVNIFNCWEDNLEVFPGKSRTEGGRCAYLSLVKASEALRAGQIDGVVTAPINKANIQSPDFQYPGHTEYYAQNFGIDGKSLMMLVSEDLRVATVTGHIPLKDVAAALTKELVHEKLTALMSALKKDFGISKPKIAVLGLNPHAGDAGLLGTEEIEIIEPVIQPLKKKGNMIFGPFPADGFFGTGMQSRFDGVLSMYHDQGLIPFKSMSFGQGVNFTAGLEIVRTSPDHGTAYNIAGRNVADESSFRTALFLALDIIKNRESTEENRKNSLKHEGDVRKLLKK